ncbi:hypothetical protein KY330_02945 [Candidatus Woesearchaeota archaeon]|nr:hypothetical protein [Candidatus Woesearchaeota archaeon]
MTSLVVCLGIGKGTWPHVARVIQEQDWEKIIIITDELGKEKFTTQKQGMTEFIVIDQDKKIPELIAQIQSSLKNKILDTEVALNFVSGTGKEHMATLAALLKLGLGIRLISYTEENGVKEL